MTDLLSMEPRLRSDQARAEAARCLQCFDAPCTAACPAGIVIPRFIRMLVTGNDQGAAKVVRSSHPLALSCGYACPDEQLCGAACLRAAIDRPIEIRRLHRYATEAGEGKGLRLVAEGRATRDRTAKDRAANDRAAKDRTAKDRAATGRSAGDAAPQVAVIGAGPAGLACAFELRRSGVAVTLFDGRERLGGVLSHTIPLYRFPEEAIARDGRWALGSPGEVDVRLSTRIAEPARLLERFDAIVVAAGVGDVAVEWEGVDLAGVVSAEAFLSRTRRTRYRERIGGEIAVIGGGNVAIDAAMAAVRAAAVQRRSARVHLLYRRTRREMPAWEREVALAEAAGVLLHFLVQPARFIGEKGKVRGIELRHTRLVERSGDERPHPEAIDGSDFLFPCDQVVIATGQMVDAELRRLLPATREGHLRTRGRTTALADGIFGAGDVTGAEQTIVSAVRGGRQAARELLAWLEGGRR